MLRLLSPGIALMNRLNYPKKLGMAMTFFFIPYLNLWSLFYHNVTNQQKAITQLEAALHKNIILSRLIHDLQQQRGYANAFLAGDETFAAT